MVRTVPKKSQQKLSIVQGIDRRVPLDELAVSLGLEFQDLLSKIEAIVYSGTKINISYFLDDIMDPDDQADIYDYFKESDTDCLKEAYAELGNDFSEEEIRLVRIKLLSELGN